jgi:hypothetical protein
MPSPEEIQQANAAELGHLAHQLTVSKHHRELLSKFLVKKDETAFGYNIHLKECISWLNQIPYSEEFVKRLVFLDEPPAAWERHLPIECTPKTHILHALYQRVLQRNSFGRDPHFGAALPKLFYRETNILTRTTSYTIDFPDKLYELRKPFGYDFPDYIEADGMLFRLIELWNPLYVKRSSFGSRYMGRPTPIAVNGTLVKPFSNAVYTLLYKKYIFDRRRELHPII